MLNLLGSDRREKRLAENQEKVADRIAGICNAKPLDLPEIRKPVKEPTEYLRPEREQIFRLGSIYIGKNAYVRCVINDVNDKGARITIQASEQLPETIVIKFDQTGDRKRADVVWQKEGMVGIKYSEDQSGIDTVCPPGAIAKKGKLLSK